MNADGTDHLPMEAAAADLPGDGAARELYPEQYELQPGRDASAAKARELWTRRTFLKAFTGGLAVLWLVDREPLLAQAESGGSGRGGRGGNRRPPELSAWLHIAADGRVTIYSGKAEVGQNVRTML